MVGFFEVFRCSGVDHDPRHPGMVVPFLGSNLVAARHGHQQIRVVSNNGAVTSTRLDGIEIRRALVGLQNELMQPGVEKGRVDAYLPIISYYDSDIDFYRINGVLRMEKGAELQIKQGNKVAARMPVMVVDPITIKIAIRDVQSFGDKNVPTNHAANAANATQETDIMNKIWLPQAQIKFELVPSSPAIIDDRDPKTREIIRKGMGLKDLSLAYLTPTVEPAKILELFRPHRIAGADLTFFVVHRLKDGNDTPSGVAFSDDQMIFITSSHFPATPAHEAGHVLGKMHHTYDIVYNKKTKRRELSDEDFRMLMRDGGAGYKIPFRLVPSFRGFRSVRKPQ